MDFIFVSSTNFWKFWYVIRALLISFDYFSNFPIWTHVNFRDCSNWTVLPTNFLRIWWRIRIWSQILKISKVKEVVSDCPKTRIFPISHPFWVGGKNAFFPLFPAALVNLVFTNRNPGLIKNPHALFFEKLKIGKSL